MLKIRFSPFRFSLGDIAPPPRTGLEAEARGGRRGAHAPRVLFAAPCRNHLCAWKHLFVSERLIRAGNPARRWIEHGKRARSPELTRAKGRAGHRAFCLRALSLGMFLTTAALVRANETAAIRTVIDAQAAAWNRGEIDAFIAGYARSPATIFVSGNEVTRGWQTVRDRYAKKYGSREKMGTLTFSRLTITPLCADAAMVLGSWSLRRKGDRPQGKFTLLFRKLPQGWRIVLDHTP